ncbi:pectin lyase fold/virulence factor [Lophiotrema nucula]|uniref:pectinesterase n=1 Tax=Lophiotrema nucula TaxID=690887 RepID=A0A6A5ZS32_9PLEO|nr:pectin lyase fold/virulence factor [Lophiotrema nucula]
MRPWLPFSALAALAVAQSNTATTTNTPLSSVDSTSITAASSATSSTSTSASKSTITVAADGSGQFSVISAALSYAQNSGYPTVLVKAATYTEALVVQATQAVTVVGETNGSKSYSSNQVTIVNSGTPLTIGLNSVQGISWYNINFVNTGTSTTAKAYAVSLRGTKNAFYNCQMISAGVQPVYSTLGITLIANSYIEGYDKVLTGYLGMYIYNTAITALGSSAILLYNQGYQVGTTFYNSTVVFDTCSLQAKSGTGNTNVYLAAPWGAGSQGIWRGTSMGSFIAPAGIHPSANSADYYGEFANTGAGSYTANSNKRSAYDYALSASQMSSWLIDQVFGNSFSGYSTFSTDWIDADVLASIKSADADQVSSSGTSSVTSSVLSTTVSASGSSSVSSSVSSLASVTTSASATLSSSSGTSTSSASTASGTYVVSTSPAAGEYSNVTAAIAALPNDGQTKTILIRAGTYSEQISITRTGKVILRGDTDFPNDYTKNTVTISFSNGQLTSAGKDEVTPVIYAKKNDNTGLALYNINFQNTYPQTKNTAALAADFYGNNMAAYGCSFVGFQDTLLANKGKQVFSNSYIEGSIDFIWGFSTAYFHQCYIATNTAGACIAAQSRTDASTAGGYVFDSCYVTYTSSYGSTFGQSYLGRPYSNFSIAVYMNSYIDKHINSAGWSVWQTSNPQTSNVLFGEFNNTGPGSWTSSTTRATFATNLTDSQAASYSLSSWIGDTTWLDMDAYNYVPSYSFPTTSTTNPTATTSATVTSVSTTATGNAIWAHPTSGTTPPAGAVLVSAQGTVSGSFSNLTAALASLPSDSSVQSVFIYPGTYTEQVPSVNRAGPVMIIGYQGGNPGQSYSGNQVTITFARGLSVSPLPTGHSDAETATFSTASNKIALYNINIVNSDNLDGAESSYVTLAGSIYGTQIAFYGCYFNGWQDTLLTGSTAGYHYYESSYIGGAIDFIWGYSKAYFKGCTIGAKRASSAMTAQSRASSTAIGGYIFDQCLFTTAPDATVDLTQKVYLGRPYSQYALVVVKNSYLDSLINPSGWKIWSATDPRTGYITFAEFNNSGPGNWENNNASRTAFGYATLLSSDSYSLSSVMDSTSWIDLTYFDSITTPQPSSVSTPGSTSNTTTPVNGSSVYDGITPPAGAYIVSKTSIEGMTTYSYIQDALNALPTSSKVTPTVFIYPGVYTEQLVVNRSGTTIFRGYSNATDDYSQNQVTITYNAGVDTQGDQSNSDSATVYATGNYFQAYNINFDNTYGQQKNIASLGFAVKSSKYASLYACRVTGNQDTLLINGYLFAFKSLIVGSIDFIWGSGSAYFLSSTISPDTDDINITADKRTTNTTQAGFVFDQCKITPYTGTGAMSKISLGRPWNNFARVAYINSYLDSCVEAAGWEQWSSSSPQTDGVLFGEYCNSGPGAATGSRANFSTQLTDASVAQFQLTTFFPITSWINFTYVDVTPFVAGTCSNPVTASTSFAMSSTSSVPLSTTLSTLMSLTSSSSSSVPLTTLYTTKTVTDKETLITSSTLSDVMITSTVYATNDVGSTITPAPVTKTTTAKATTTTSSTIVEVDVTSISTTVVTQDNGLTITPDPVYKTSTLTSTTIISAETTKAGKTSTVQGTVTITTVKTVTPAATTSTIDAGQTITSTISVTPKPSTLTSSTTTTISGSTTTVTSKSASTIYISQTSLKTTTKKVTTTLSCIPTAAAKAKRDILAPRAASLTTVTQYTTFLTYVKTSTVSIPGSTYSSTITVPTTIGSTTTLKPATTTVTATSFKIVTSVYTQPGSTFTSTTTSTQTVGKTTTLKASTSTITSTVGITSTSYKTITAPTATVSSFKTSSVASTTTLPRQTVLVTKSADETVKTTTTLPQTTSTVVKTVTSSEKGVTITVPKAEVTKTTTVKSTVTAFSTAVKTTVWRSPRSRVYDI